MLEPLNGRRGGGASVGLDFDARFAWPIYDWMGVAKSALESITRYLARDLGRTTSGSTPSPPGRSARWPARASPASTQIADAWDARAPSAGRDRSRRRWARCAPSSSPTWSPDDDRRGHPRRRRLPRMGDGLQAPFMTDLRTAAQHFDELGAPYDAQIREMVPRYEEIHDTIVALFPCGRRAASSISGRDRLHDAPNPRRCSRCHRDRPGRVAGDAPSRGRAADGVWGARRAPPERHRGPEIIGAFDAIVSILAVHHLFPDQKRHLFSRIWRTHRAGRRVRAGRLLPAGDGPIERALTTSPTSPIRTRSSTTIPTRRPSTSPGSLPPASRPSTSVSEVRRRRRHRGVEGGAPRPLSASWRPPPRGRAAGAWRPARRRSRRALRRWR